MISSVIVWVSMSVLGMIAYPIGYGHSRAVWLAYPNHCAKHEHDVIGKGMLNKARLPYVVLGIGSPCPHALTHTTPLLCKASGNGPYT